MDKYDSENDPYCYPGTNTLINKLNIRELGELEQAEKEITTITSKTLVFSPPPYDLSYMQKIHHLLFSNLYSWAGEIRNVDISKGGTRFCNCTRINAEAQRLFNNLGEKEKWLKGLTKENFCSKLAEYYCEINMLHPFREGNGRVQRVLFEHLALAAGYDLDWSAISPDEWIQANIDGFHVKDGLHNLCEPRLRELGSIRRRGAKVGLDARCQASQHPKRPQPSQTHGATSIFGVGRCCAPCPGGQPGLRITPSPPSKNAGSAATGVMQTILKYVSMANIFKRIAIACT